MQILAIGFALFIIIGGVLLSLPIASRGRTEHTLLKQSIYINLGHLRNWACRL